MKSPFQQTRGYEITEIKSLDEIPGLLEYLDALDAIEARRVAARPSPCVHCDAGGVEGTPPGQRQA